MAKAEIHYKVTMTLAEARALYWAIKPELAGEHYGDEHMTALAYRIERKLGNIIEGADE